MLRKISIQKLIITSVALFALLLIYLMPNREMQIKPISSFEYVSNSIPIFLIDKNNYVALSSIYISDKKTEEKAKKLINYLIINDDNKIPNGFKAIIPPNTRILNLSYSNNLIKVDFSKDILDIDKENEEKMVEAIVYTLTSINDVKKVIIYVEGQVLTKLPKSKINLPSTLDRSIGINKEYDFTSKEDINNVTIYYVNKSNDKLYYIPVTKYLNDNRDKISIVIDQLSSNTNSNNLMSFLNSDVKLVSSNFKEKTLNLDFNNSIFDDITTKEVLEEVIYTICLSAYDNYDVKNVVLTVNNKEIYKSVSENIEKYKTL